MHSFEVFLATSVVFWGSGTLGYTLLQYRLGHKNLVSRTACGVGGVTFTLLFLTSRYMRSTSASVEEWRTDDDSICLVLCTL